MRKLLVEVVAIEKSTLIPQWTNHVRKRMGISGQLSASWHVIKRWGIKGLLTIRKSERVFRSEQLGYCLIAGKKP